MRFLQLLLIAGLAVPAGAADEGCIEVDGDRILARHFARANAVFAELPPQRPLAYVPTAGVQRVLTAAQLRRIARQHGLVDDGLSPACFERASELLTLEGILDVMRDELGTPEARLEIVDFSRRPVPRGVLAFPIAGLSSPSKSDPEKPVLWRGTVRYGNRRSASIWARVRLTVPRRQVVAKRDLSPGEPITAADLAEQTVEAFPAKKTPVASLEEAVGTVPRRRIRAGQALSSTWLMAPKEVERGTTVVVEVTSGKARLRFEAKAESSGRQGDSVWIRNPGSGHRFKAIVAGKGRVSLRVTRQKTS